MKTKTTSKAAISQQIQSLMESLGAAIATEDLSIQARRKVLGTLRRGILPKNILKSFSTKRDRLDRAYADYKTGVRGTQLFEKHISYYKTLSWWRRRGEQTRLRKALEKRAQREQRAKANGDKS
jgi:hypothetical protein